MAVDALGLPLAGSVPEPEEPYEPHEPPAPGPADALRARLDDPATAAALHRLLDHVDLLAVLVVGLDGFAARSEAIGDSVVAGLDELRAAGAGDGVAGALDTARRLAPLPGAVAGAAPGIGALLDSPLVEPSTVEVLGLVARALVTGRAAAAAEPAPSRLRLLRALRDDHVRRGLALLVHTARALGRSL